VAGSINIPLNEVPHRVEELRQKPRPLILCCASGNRSGQATYFLEQHGLEEVYNGGGWMQVNHAISTNS
jgi:rhodanese-related sulfurtransferase